MSRLLDRLSDWGVRAASEPGRLPDGGGLYLVVDPSGARRWLFRYRTAGREREAGLGGYPTVSLAEARRRRDEARQLLSLGRDPIDERRKVEAAAAPAVTFGAFAAELVPELSKGYRNPKHRQQWTNTLRAYAAPIWSKPIAEVATADVLDCLRPIWTTKAETASRVRGRIERVLDAAKAKGLRTGDNPATWKGNLAHLLPKPKKLTRGHHAALPYPDLPAFVARLRERPAGAALALEFLILTASRSGEVLGARWGEIDRDARTWTVPGDRMKGGREHRVPLPGRAIAVLDEAAKVRRGEWVFPSFRADRSLSGGAFDALLERMKVRVTAHGFRSSFRDWAAEETSHPRELAEQALAHVVGSDVERAYRRGDALAKRRQLMADWAAYLNGSPSR